VASTSDPYPLSALVRNAFLLRFCTAIVLHVFFEETLFAPDQETYHFFSAWLARYWSGESLVYPGRLLIGEPKGYYYIVASLYYVFGEFALLPKLLNAGVGALTVRLAHDIANRITGNEAMALRTAKYVCYFPSLVLWSALNIRDCWVVLCIVLITREVLLLQERFRPLALLRVVAAIFLMTQFRDYLLFAVTLPMILAFVVRNQRHLLRNAVVGMILATVVISADQAAGMNRKLRTPDFEQLNSMRRWSSTAAASGFAQDADISTPGKALAFLPVGLAYFLLAPFPWTIVNFRQGITLPEMLFFYSLLPPMFTGIRVLLRERLSQSLMVLLITAGLTLGYAIGQGNVGTIYRHRAQVLAFYLMFAAVGVEARKARRSPAPLPQGIREARVVS